MELEETNRKINIYILSTLVVIIAIVGSVFFSIYLKKSRLEYLTYREDGKIKYDVSLLENEYFEESILNENNQYIASLIDKINSNFKYNMKLAKESLYSYKYKITADVSVVDEETKRHLYSSSRVVMDEISGESNESLWIDENVIIDYKNYNELIAKFINVYNLKKVTGNLDLNLFLEISGDNWEMKNYNKPVASLNIPLAINTIAIDPEYDLKDESESSILLGVKDENASLWLKIALGIFGVDVCILVGLIIYIIVTASEKDKYKHKLKTILNNYGSYISVIEDDIDMDGFKVLKVSTFIDLLEIRDTVRMPIIMVENKEQFSTYFAIPSNDILYFFVLGIQQPVLASGQLLEENSYDYWDNCNTSEGSEEISKEFSINKSEEMQEENDIVSTELVNDSEESREDLRDEDETRV